MTLLVAYPPCDPPQPTAALRLLPPGGGGGATSVGEAVALALARIGEEKRGGREARTPRRTRAHARTLFGGCGVLRP